MPGGAAGLLTGAGPVTSPVSNSLSPHRSNQWATGSSSAPNAECGHHIKRTRPKIEPDRDTASSGDNPGTGLQVQALTPLGISGATAEYLLPASRVLRSNDPFWDHARTLVGTDLLAGIRLSQRLGHLTCTIGGTDPLQGCTAQPGLVALYGRYCPQASSRVILTRPISCQVSGTRCGSQTITEPSRPRMKTRSSRGRPADHRQHADSPEAGPAPHPGW